MCQQKSRVHHVVDVARFETATATNSQSRSSREVVGLEFFAHEPSHQGGLGHALGRGTPVECLIQVVVDADLQPLHSSILHHIPK